MQLVVDDRRVFAATGGHAFDQALAAVAFVHGAGMDHTVWALPARHFAHQGRAVLALDLPGHGRSEGPALGRIEAMARWLLRALDAAGVREAALCGHSMGALVALAAALHAPERVRSLALLATALPMRVGEELLGAAREEPPRAFRMITGWGFSRRAQLGSNPAPGLWLTGAGLRLLERGSPGALATGLAACDAYAASPADAAALRCPVLLLLGARDRMTPPKAARALAEALPQARTEILDDAGHMLMAEEPDRVLDALREVL